MNIKEYRDKELPVYVVALCIVILYLSGLFSFETIKIDCNSIELLISIIESVLCSAVVSVFVLIFDGMISSDTKGHLVFLWKKMPGNTVFSDMKTGKAKDMRFTKEQVINKYHDTYKKLDCIADSDKANYENSCWYKIYKNHMAVTSIYISQRDYLLCRDMNFATVVMTIIYIVTFHLTPISYNWKSFACLVIMYIVTRHSTINKSKRFVLNVIACDIHEELKFK